MDEFSAIDMGISLDINWSFLFGPKVGSLSYTCWICQVDVRAGLEYVMSRAAPSSYDQQGQFNFNTYILNPAPGTIVIGIGRYVTRGRSGVSLSLRPSLPCDLFTIVKPIRLRIPDNLLPA